MPSTRLLGQLEDLAQNYLGLFAGRDDAYNRYTGCGYVTERQPLTPAVIVGAWTDRPSGTVGSYFLTPDSTGHVVAIDFDRPDGWDLACRIGTVMWEAGAPGYVERSRDGRAHLWATAETRLPGIVLHRALRVWIADASVLPTVADLHTANIELRPPSDRLSSPTSLGHALRMPVMAHPITGETHPLADPRTGEPLGTTVAEMLVRYELVPAERFMEATERYRPPATAAAAPRRALTFRGPSPIAAFNAQVGCSDVLQRDWGVTRAIPGRSVPCPLHGDESNRYLSIARDDRRAWCHSGGCELSADGRGNDAYGLWALSKGRQA